MNRQQVDFHTLALDSFIAVFVSLLYPELFLSLLSRSDYGIVVSIVLSLLL